ncbi:hypothetical protein ACHFJ0_21855 [Paracoccus sp. NGMCC 1.201697]|uniref:Uncharacterized protein n=1 Tax=Paracoccus broussonetiae subsp. drimophilus TaxID=3373869 RepID=A0ABW7LUD5_9RHOB
MKTRDNITIVFIASRGAASLRQRLLVLSVRKFLPKSVRILAVIPKHAVSLNSDTIELYEALDVEIRSIATPLYFKFNDRGLIKIDYLKSEQPSGRVILLNSGCIFTSRPEISDLKESKNVFLANHAFGKSDEAEKLASEAQNRLQQSKPNEDKKSIPILNSGVVIYDGESSFADTWSNNCAEVVKRNIGGSFGLKAAEQIGLSLTALDDKLVLKNLPLKWNMTPRNSAQATLVQYFDFATLIREKHALATVEDLSSEADELGLNALGELTIRDLRSIARVTRL